MPDPRETLPADTVPVRVWDLPTRLFHWLLLISVVGAVVCVKLDLTTWHFRFGYAVCALLAFRLLWGVFGGRWSRFTSFVFSPMTTWRYLRASAAEREALEVGHGPLGALSVFAMLALLVAQVATGLIGDDEIANVGPLNHLVSTDAGIAATGWHSTWGQGLLFGLVALHLAAIVAYALRGKRLVGPMVRGDKLLPADTPSSADGARQRGLALALLAACALGVWAIVRSGG